MNQHTFETNIIKWYPFAKNKSILQIGKNENIKKELKEKIQDVYEVENIKQIDENARYDYIFIYGYEKNNEKIEKIVKHLKEDGKILIVGNNKYGINNWSKYSNVLNLEDDNNQIQGIKNVKRALKNSKLNNINTFLVFPNYTNPEIIINTKTKIENSYIDKYTPYIKNDQIKLFDERKVLKNILKENNEIIEFFSNAYFIEASKKEIEINIKFVSYNNCRKKEYRLITIIEDNIVKKIPATVEAQEHIKNMQKTIEDVKSYDIEILDYSNNDGIYSKFLNGYKTLDEILGEKYNDLETIKSIFNEMKNLLINKSISYEECKDKMDLKGINLENVEKLHFLEKAFWDMIAKNCFWVDGKYIFFDQEWEAEYLPVEFLIYRSIINSYDLVKRINVDNLLESLEMLEYKEYFQAIDNELRNKIIDKDIYNEMYENNIIGIDNLINDKKIAEQCLEQEEKDNVKKQNYINELEEDNNKKQKYINELEEDSAKKQKYIEDLETDRKSKEEYIKILEEKTKRKFFWKGK